MLFVSALIIQFSGMRLHLFFRFLAALATFALPCVATAQDSPRDSFTVYFFLLEDCKITQAYTDRIGEIYQQYHGDSIGFVGLFPNPISTDSSATAFREKYGLPFACTTLLAAETAEKMGVSVTPEVVLFNETKHKTLYQGRIDNLYERLGERRSVVTSFELEAALHAVRHFREVPIPRTRAVGCFLPKAKPK
jgi:hypothetical protein